MPYLNLHIFLAIVKSWIATGIRRRRSLCDPWTNELFGRHRSKLPARSWSPEGSRSRFGTMRSAASWSSPWWPATTWHCGMRPTDMAICPRRTPRSAFCRNG